jgi:serine/threonine-protein kinase
VKPVLGELSRDTRIGDYEVEGKIGEGAMGVVYRAVHPAIRRHVAIKIMNAKHCTPGGVERFTREARSVAAIRHPGIVDAFGFGTLPDGRAYLIMEWLEGMSLAKRIARSGLTLDEALDVIDQIARALEAAHSKHIIHRDLKPDNVFLEHVANERPIVKILDFGLAKLAREEPGGFQTLRGHTVGTPIYMSPEQYRARAVDHRTDIYALGCMAYELVCGRVPFIGRNTAELTTMHLREPPPRPNSLKPDIPPALDELLFSMIAKDPAARPTLQQVRQTISTLRGPVQPKRLPKVRKKWPRLYRRIAIVVLVVGAGVIVGYAATQLRPRAPTRGTSSSGSGSAGAHSRATLDAGTAPPPTSTSSNAGTVPTAAKATPPNEKTSPTAANASKTTAPANAGKTTPANAGKTTPTNVKASSTASTKQDPNTTTINPLPNKKAPP